VASSHKKGELAEKAAMVGEPALGCRCKFVGASSDSKGVDLMRGLEPWKKIYATDRCQCGMTAVELGVNIRADCLD